MLEVNKENNYVMREEGCPGSEAREDLYLSLT